MGQPYEKERFSAVFYLRHRKHIFRIVLRMTALFLIGSTLTGINLFSFFNGTGDINTTGIAAAVFGAISLFITWSTIQSLRNLARVRVLPYFERPVGQKDTWSAGENYLQHSRQLDKIAAEVGVRPLSEFSSGDDLMFGEVLCWFSPEDALRTVERLLQADIITSFPSTVVSDLTHIRDALRLACSQSVKFCFLLREGTSACGLEMERRKGSFF